MKTEKKKAKGEKAATTAAAGMDPLQLLLITDILLIT